MFPLPFSEKSLDWNGVKSHLFKDCDFVKRIWRGITGSACGWFLIFIATPKLEIEVFFWSSFSIVDDVGLEGSL